MDAGKGFGVGLKIKVIFEEGAYLVPSFCIVILAHISQFYPILC